MEALATAPARRQAQRPPRDGSLLAEILEYCAEPRDMNEITEWLGAAAGKFARVMTARGQLVNLRPARAIGVYVDPARVPLLVERICWHAPDAGGLDDDVTVLLSVEGQGEPHDAFRCAGTWYWAASGAPITARVIAWAHKPAGPEAQR